MYIVNPRSPEVENLRQITRTVHTLPLAWRYVVIYCVTRVSHLEQDFTGSSQSLQNFFVYKLLKWTSTISQVTVVSSNNVKWPEYTCDPMYRPKRVKLIKRIEGIQQILL